MTSQMNGLFLMALGIAVMCAMDAIIKFLSGDISAIQILFFRSLFGLIPVIGIIWMKGGIKTIRTKKPMVHLVRAGLGVVAFVSFTLGVSELSLANALAICFASPFFMVIFSIVLLKENIGIHRLSAMVFGFLGVLVILRPDQNIFSDAALYLLIVAFSYGLSQVIARKYAQSETAVSYSFWTTLGMAIFGLALLPFGWVPLSLEQIIWCLAMGVTGGIAHYLIVEAVRLAPTSVVAPVEYSALIWAGIIDWAIWTTLPNYSTIIGSIMIMAGGLYILFRERKHKGETA